MRVNAEALISGLGGTQRVAAMSDEAKADALEQYLSATVEQAPAEPAATTQRTVADIDADIETKNFRRGVGKLFVDTQPVTRLRALPAAPTLLDFFRLRFQPANHLLQSAALAMKQGLSEEIVLACLLHDAGQFLMRAEHGEWGAQLFRPYVSARTAFAIRYHQVLRFYPDGNVGYEYPEMYHRIFGVDYTPPPHVEREYRRVRAHKWYMDARMVTVNDIYAFDPNVVITIEPFIDIIGRQFRQPPEGLGHDKSSAAHMWRALANPDAPL